MPFYRIFALAIASFPGLLLLGVVLIPVVKDFRDHDSAEKAVEQSRRWFWGHALSGIAFGYGIVATCCLAAVLVDAEQFLWAGIAVPFAVIGGSLLIVGMGADGIGPLAVRATGAPARTFFDGSARWVVGTSAAGIILFSIGQFAWIIGINQTQFLSTATGVIMLVAALAFALSPILRSGYALYVTAALAVIIYTPAAWLVWQLGSV